MHRHGTQHPWRAAMSGRHHGPGGWGHPGGGPRGWGGGRRQRMRRGATSAPRCWSCSTSQPHTGYQPDARRSSAAAAAPGVPSPGSVYPTLQQLEDEGPRPRPRSGGGRAPFSLTEAGTAYVAENREELGEPWAKLADGRRRGAPRAARTGRPDRRGHLPGGRRRRHEPGRPGQGAARARRAAASTRSWPTSRASRTRSSFDLRAGAPPPARTVSCARRGPSWRGACVSVFPATGPREASPARAGRLESRRPARRRRRSPSSSAPSRRSGPARGPSSSGPSSSAS